MPLFVRHVWIPILASLLALAPGGAMGAQITVNSAADNNTRDTMLTLREAVLVANGTLAYGTLTSQEQAQFSAVPGASNTIVFDPSLAGQTIDLGIDGDDTFGPSALPVTGTLTINGGSGGITLARDTTAAPTRLRFFYVASGGNLTLMNVTVSGGVSLGGNGGNGGGGAAGLGGAIVNGGTLNVIQCSLTSNAATGGNGAGNDGFVGGGGGLGGDGGFTGGNPNGGAHNSAGGFGGGGGGTNGSGSGGFGGFGGGGGSADYPGGFGGGGGGGSSGGAGGFAGGAGAGGYNGGGGGGLGGAIFNYGGTLVVTNSTLASNSATGGTGATNGQGLGGAIFNLNGSVTISDATLASNTAAQGGGAVYNLGDIGVATQAGPALPSTAGSVAITDAILVYSAGGVSDYVQNNINSGSVSSSGTNNFIMSGTTFQGTASSTDPMLSALANNGGPTQTMALLAGSPARLAGIAISGITVDQRGFPRHAIPDVGAYEAVRNSLVVTTTVDEDNGTSDPADGAGTSLREALEYAASLSGTPTITFSNSTTGGAVNFFDGTARTIMLGAELEINSNVTIVGPGAGVLTLSGNNASRILSFGGVTSTVSGLTLAFGNAVGATLTGNGGAVLQDGGVLTLNDCVLTNNTTGATTAGAIASVFGTLTMNNTSVTNNQCVNCSGLYIQNGSATVTACTFSGNSGNDGDPIRCNAATISMFNCTVSNNTTSGGCASAVTNQTFGGSTSTVTLTNCTVSGNTCSSAGGPGAIDNQTGSGTTTLVLQNTIVSGNTVNGAPQDINGTVDASSANNLIGTGGGLSNGANGNIVGVNNPMLAALGNYGGPTLTMALLSGSPALNAGSSTAAMNAGLTTDQRGAGFPRISGSSVDIGAFEYQLTESLVVTTLVDEDNGTSDPTIGAGTSLREALNYAQSLAGAQTITFASGLTGAIMPNSALVVDSESKSPVTIQGPGVGLLTLDGSNMTRIFFIDSGNLVVNDMTLTHANPGAVNGGAIFNLGTLTLNRVAVTNNQIVGGTNFDGAGIFSGGTLTISDSTFSGNSGAYFGGAIGIYAGTLTLSNSTISGNSAAFNGGLIIVGASGTVTNCTFTGNSGGQGAVSGEGTGETTLNFLNTTIANNPGGGFDNLGGTYSFQNTILAGNNGFDVVNSINSLGNNLIEFAPEGSGFVASDILNVDPMLGPLQNNGGPTQTMALLPGSAAIDAGNTSAAIMAGLANDQRGAGYVRQSGSNVDIGAYELQGPLAFTIHAGTPQSATVNTAFGVSLQTLLEDSTGAPLAGASVTFTAPTEGASGVFSNSSNTITISTDSSGFATASITANAFGGSYTVTAALPGAPTVSFALTNILSPTITSANNAQFIFGTGGTFTIQTVGFPIPAITESTLPSGVTVTDNGDGTATMVVSSTAAAGAYPLQLTAANGNKPDFVQSFTLTVVQNAPVVPPLNSDQNPGLINTPVYYTFTATDAVASTLSYVFSFGDGSPSISGSFLAGTNVTVSHTYTAYTDGVTVTLTVSNGAIPVTVTTLQTVPEPASGDDDIINIALDQPPVVAPLSGIGMAVTYSSGGVIQLGIDIDSLTRSAFVVSTDFGDIQGRSATVTGLSPVHDYTHRGLFVATTTATNAGTNVVAGKARLTLALSAKETNDYPPGAPQTAAAAAAPAAGNRAANGILPNDTPAISTKMIKGKFDFSGKTPDLISFEGTITLPAGLDLRSDYEFWIAIGNIVVETTIVKGKGTNPSVPGIIRSLRIKTKAPIKFITVGGEQATISVTYYSKGTVNAGFDTEGISNMSPDVGNGQTAARKIQVAMLVAGAPFQTVTPVTFAKSSNGDFGSIQGRSGK